MGLSRGGRSRRTTTRAVVSSAGVLAAAVLVLSGCASGSGGSDETAAPVPTASDTPSSSAPTTPTTTAPTSGATPGADATGSGAAGSGSAGSGAAGSGSAGSGSAGRDACAVADLAGSIEPGSGGAAGSVVVHLALRNTGTTTCTVQGWPGVSFVGGGDGTQIGAPATLDRSAPHPTVSLAPGSTAVAPLKVTRAENVPSSDCSPVTPEGFRVYPPGSEQSLFVAATSYTACRSSDTRLLSVQAFVAEGQATD
ncbi:DUF4232 domain-containing protein [Curtobacterium aetherium]|uniref:DUF4232 domain-containing protein n=1 Tax=Curtobacterium aetherium TaxID=2841594 RepID=A0ACD1E2L7_9MICO|nr:DUF4232 domain-containing protein [Curtobacterium sp. L6-1]QWS33145.1 DUF4232 domain-containing protein [Curtobacterium sp. L6-1]